MGAALKQLDLTRVAGKPAEGRRNALQTIVDAYEKSCARIQKSVDEVNQLLKRA